MGDRQKVTGSGRSSGGIGTGGVGSREWWKHWNNGKHRNSGKYRNNGRHRNNGKHRDSGGQRTGPDGNGRGV